ncbi:hypothetical protein BGZ96_004960 [Linnemannia gamsii]|uniref:polynucleotide adenylyltransferase n=1 Tax=Linnemannia gamsii TaxID=64522 RepID=A0ABQ7KGQ6_9FUNG|nr:hypothetical protein BGZ96_004960 [Linnemannia gamsii]
MPMVHTTTQPGTDDSFPPVLTTNHHNHQQQLVKVNESAPTPSHCEPASSISEGELLPVLQSKTSVKSKEAPYSHDPVEASNLQQLHYIEQSDSSNNEDDNQDHTAAIDQGLAFQARCQSLRRPDSPTSLEDSQSDSGLDSFAADMADKERLMTRFPIDVLPLSKLSMTDRNITSATIPDQQELLNGNSLMSPSQVATPPLSPIKAIVHNKSDDDDDDTLEDGDDESIANGIGKEARTFQSATLDESDSSTLQEISEAQQILDQVFEEEQTCGTDSGLEALLPSLQEETSSASLSADDASGAAGSSTSPTGNLPKVSAWSTLLPGVAPIPQPKPSARLSAIQRSEQVRLHERFPIVLPYESQVKLSMEMVDLFESLLPTEQSHERRTKFIKKVETILSVEWPGEDIQAYPFGSTVNDLGTSTSDVDICIMTTWSGLKNVQMLANAFRKHGMQKVFCVPRAKVPIVKLWDPELHLSCDVNINTPLGLLNTKMIKTYVTIDPRVRPFAMIIKHWARRRVLNDAANGGTISTYTWICIVINFLQMRSPPILPVLHKIPHALSEDNQVINGNNTSFCDDIESLEGFGFPNKETLGGLLYAFFRRFAIEFDYDHHVISVREGCYLTKESKGWHLPGKQYKMFCVEEPIDTSRNLGNSSDMTSSKGLREEFRRALDILYKNASLNLCCAQFVFPPSYYSNNVRKGTNGTIITNNNNYAAGRRYLNGYRSQNYYYDEADYDDDDDDDSVGEISVMETLNIGTRPAHSKNPTGSSKQHSGRRDSVSSSNRSQGSEKGGASSKESNNTSGRQGETASHRSQSKNRAKQTKSDKDSASSTAGDFSKPASSSRGKQEKSSSSSSTTANRRNKKSPGGSGGDGQKGGRGSGGGNGSSNGSAGGNSGRAPRAAVEFSLADIATVAPKLLSASSKADQESLLAAVDNFVGSDPVGSTDGSKNRSKKRTGSKNVVWSTNSNRGESSRRQQPINKGAQQPAEQDKTRVIIVASEDSSSSFNHNNATATVTNGDTVLST